MYKKLTALLLSLILLGLTVTACTKEDTPKTGSSSQLSDTPMTPESTATFDETMNTDTAEKDGDIKAKNNDDISSDALKAEKITVSSKDITINEGETFLLTAEVIPTNEKAVWSSSDKTIADVTDEGIVTAVKEGKCVITAAAQTNSDIYESIKVTVRKKQSLSSSQSEQQTAASERNNDNEDQKPQQVEAISLNYKAITIDIGEKATPVVTFTPSNDIDNDKINWSSSNEFIATVDSSGCITGCEEGSCIITAVSESNKDAAAQIDVTVAKPREPAIDDNAPQEYYIDGILIVNKTYSLPRDYNPGGLTSECAAAFEELRHGAAEDGINIYVSSGFRSYSTQEQLYNGYVSMYGREAADRFSARPGHSEHQTGLAVDCNYAGDYFAGTPEAIWLEEHCYEYGFIIRYPQGKESITGYKYEPWHIRYIGDMAQTIYESGLTLEEYFGISSEYNY